MQLPYDSVHDLLRMTYDLIAIIFCQPDDDYLLHEWHQIGCRYSMGNYSLKNQEDPTSKSLSFDGFYR